MSTQLIRVAPVQAASQRVVKQPPQNAQISLGEAYALFHQPEAEIMPWQIWLLENTRSPLSGPGSMLQFNRACFHILLNRSTALADEAYVMGFLMGSDLGMGSLRLGIYKFAARWLYPKAHRLSVEEFRAMCRGFEQGREPKFRNFCRLDFRESLHLTVEYLRRHLELEGIVTRLCSETPSF